MKVLNMPQIKGGKKVLLRIWIRVTWKLDQDPHPSEKPYPDPHQIQEPRYVEVHRGAMEAYN
jgi:hypothetical protein